jgi:hypothetical protein
MEFVYYVEPVLTVPVDGIVFAFGVLQGQLQPILGIHRALHVIVGNIV